MPSTSPFLDCTNAALQAMNRSDAGPVLKRPITSAYTHSPYVVILDPREPSSADDFEATFGSPCLSSTQESWLDSGLTRSSSPYPGFPQTEGRRSRGQLQEEEPYEAQAVFRSNTHSPSPAAVAPSWSPVLPYGAATAAAAATPSGRRYQQLQQQPKSRSLQVEVKVQLRGGASEFLVKDMWKLLQTDDSAALINTYVIVEGDRGEDMGCITHLLTSDDGSNSSTPNTNLKKVCRVATSDDMAKFAALEKDEAEALSVCCETIKKIGMNTEICVEGAVFQFDKRKLTIQYTADSYVDFTQLTRILHNYYKCRIWMDQLNRSSALQESRLTRGKAAHHIKQQQQRRTAAAAAAAAAKH